MSVGVAVDSEADVSVRTEQFAFSVHDGITVLRDDRHPGGTKARVLSRILPCVTEEVVVYAGHPYGFGSEALAIASANAGKSAKLLFPRYAGWPNELSMPMPMRRACGMPNVDFLTVGDPESTQTEIDALAIRYANDRGYFHFPVGFDYPDFFEELKSVILAVPNIDQFEEVWTVAGSGTLARALHEALPHARICAVNLRMPHCRLGNIHQFQAEMGPEEAAIDLPPFASARYYDAKAWAILRANASEKALFWNVAG